ncbi:MAG: rRNA maturation RNase YbeY, partial [Candidatus Kaiserbacteria bacterium]|nr:rRNA maturation RNase YbeY [Candidatus Kaiserbacteria bacterium]
IAKEVLPQWDISLVFIGPKKARALNEQLRGKTYTPNVLSYTVGKKSGEIFICPSEAAKQAPSFNLPLAPYTLFLFIHGLLHLKGWAHSVTMERCERKLLAHYVATNSNWHRHRHLPDKNGRGRGAH